MCIRALENEREIGRKKIKKVKKKTVGSTENNKKALEGMDRWRDKKCEL